MTTHTPEQIQRRLTLLAKAAADATASFHQLNVALINARAARADVGVLHELEAASAAITRATKRAEIQRQRLLRKANRQGVTP
jgi:hypothetical protein